MEEQLHKEFRELRRKGIKVKGWWFKSRAGKILDSTQPDNTFKYSLGWFTHFKTRYKISLRRATNTAQKVPQDKEAAIVKSRLQVRGMVHRKSGLNFVKLQMLIRLPSPFHLQMVQPMKL